MNAKLNWVTLQGFPEVNFVSLSCIGLPLWDLCECQVVIEETVSLFVILIIKNTN